MRIAFYAPMKPPAHPVPSGDRQMARLLWAALERAGHQVELASTLRSYDGRGDRCRQRRLAALGPRLAGRIVRRYRSRPAPLRPQLWLTYHLYHKAPDLLGPAVASALGIPYVVAEASVAPKQAHGAWAAGYAAAAEAIAAADLCIVLNSADRPCLLAAVRSPTALRSLAPFIIAGPFLKAAEDREHHRHELTRRLGLDPNAPVLATVAMMREGDKLRSYEQLGLALARLADRPWTLLVAGDGPAQAEVKPCVDAALGEPYADREGRVRWLGRVDSADLPAVYAAADLHVWPAVNEAYGVALLEAQAAATPVVAGAAGGVADIVRDGVTGLLVPAGDAAVFAAAVERLLDDPGRRRHMGRQAADHVRRYHDLPVAAASLDGLLRMVANAEASP